MMNEKDQMFVRSTGLGVGNYSEFRVTYPDLGEENLWLFTKSSLNVFEEEMAAKELAWKKWCGRKVETLLEKTVNYGS